MNEFEPITDREEKLNDAVEALLSDHRLPQHRMTPELDIAMKLKAQHKDPHMRAEFDRSVEAALLQEFSTQKTYAWNGIWKWSLAGAMAALAIATTLVFSPFHAQTKTIAEIQNFESLSATEAILGLLPANSETEEGVRIADIREEVHEIALLRNSANLALDEHAQTGEFPHVELRDNALEVIDREQTLIAQVDISIDIETFAGKVAEWPTQNEGVDFETHEKAVNGYIDHSQTWEEALEKWAIEQLNNLN